MVIVLGLILVYLLFKCSEYRDERDAYRSSCDWYRSRLEQDRGSYLKTIRNLEYKLARRKAESRRSHEVIKTLNEELKKPKPIRRRPAEPTVIEE